MHEQTLLAVAILLSATIGLTPPAPGWALGTTFSLLTFQGPFFVLFHLLSKIRGWSEPGSADSTMKRLIRRCPMCKEVMGIVIAAPVKNVRPIHGLCMKCGYGFRWAIIRSSAT